MVRCKRPCGGQGRNRTTDTRIFSRRCNRPQVSELYQLTPPTLPIIGLPFAAISHCFGIVRRCDIGNPISARDLRSGRLTDGGTPEAAVGYHGVRPKPTTRSERRERGRRRLTPSSQVDADLDTGVVVMSRAKSEGTSPAEGGNYRRGMGLTLAKPGLVVLCLLQKKHPRKVGHRTRLRNLGTWL